MSNLPEKLIFKIDKIEKKIKKPEKIFSEVNLLNLPFFLLEKRNLKNQRVVEYKEVVERNGEKVEVSWQAFSLPKFKHPDFFDKDVYWAIQSLINEKGLPIQNPIKFTLTEIAERMGLKSDGGRDLKRIEEAFKRIIMVGVDSKGAYYNKEKKTWIEDIFHIYDRVIFRGETLPDGNIAETNHLFLGSWYLQNLNSFYIKTIDYNFYRRLELPIAKRLYEILSLRFYGLKDKPFYRISYKKLCMLMPITPQKYFSKAIQILEPAHKKLIEERFLEKVEYQKNGKLDNFNILYFPGRKAKEEIESPKVLKETVTKCLPEPKKDVTEDEFNIEERLLCEKISEKLKIRKKTIFNLIKEHKLEKVRKAYEYALEKANENPAGFFLKSLKEEYSLPKNKEEARKVKEFKQEAHKCYYQVCYGNCPSTWERAKKEKDKKCCYWCPKYDKLRDQEEN